LVREAAAALEPARPADNITLSLSAAPGLPPVIGERDELIQLFQNLIHNAIKYGRENPAAMSGSSCSAGFRRPRRQPRCWRSARDDGEGIPPERRPRLTERFYRVDVKRSREKGGTGLGLAIVKHIVNRHQGRLTSRARPGEGSTFTVFCRGAAHRRRPLPVTEML
jgi:two-component system phosphate regulon sensor histidine kinase PhoR